ncbi:MAG: hypothetical protein AB7I04_14220 [Pseudomonadales bacterium]
MTDIREGQISDLLALRDGELPEAEAAGVLSRAGSAATLERIHGLRDALRALPDPEPDEALWERIRAAATPPDGQGRGGAVMRFPGRFLPYAAAAGLVLALGAGLLGVNAARQTNGTAEAATDPVLQQLYERSKRLEPLMLSGDRRDPTERALRLRIADLDGQITGNPDAGVNPQTEQQLWSQRVALLESLAEVRRARVTVQPAVY